MTERKKKQKITEAVEAEVVAPKAETPKGSVFVSMTEGGASASRIKTTHELYMEKDGPDE